MLMETLSVTSCDGTFEKFGWKEHMTVFRQDRTLLDQGCQNFDQNFFGASVHEKNEI